ncbi:MAG: hypothetical protein ACPGVS_06500 [Primorskyibacter sp.]
MRLTEDIAAHPERWPMQDTPRHVVIAPSLGQRMNDTSALAKALNASVRIHCHLDTPARMALRFYVWAVLAGRNASAQDMLSDCSHPAWMPKRTEYNINSTPHWIDINHFIQNWTH